MCSFVDAFPMTITGKIQKFVLSEQMADALDLENEVDSVMDWPDHPSARRARCRWAKATVSSC